MQLTSIRSGMLMRAFTSAPFLNLKLNSGFSAFVGTPRCDRRRDRRRCLRDLFIICFSQHFVDSFLVVCNNCLYGSSDGTIAFKVVSLASVATVSATATSPAASALAFILATPASSTMSVAPVATSSFSRWVTDLILVLVYQFLAFIFQCIPFLGFKIALWIANIHSIL